MSAEFRYHVASLSAVFLALGIGILVGTAFVGNKIVDRQTSLIHNLEERVQDFRRETLERERTEAALKELVPNWLSGRLTGRAVLLVQTGRYNDAADEAERVLRRAGATVARLSLAEDAWYRSQDIEAAARALATRIADGAALGEAESGGLFRGEVSAMAGRSVVLVGGVSTAEALGGDQSPTRLLRERDAPLLQVLLERGVRVVGVEPVAAEVSFLGAWRNAGIATVDCIDRAPGAIALVAALEGEVGAFGLRADADRAVPKSVGATGIGPLSVCAIIPAYNEADRIGATVTAAATLPGVTRVLVVDDGSTDETAARAQAAGATVHRMASNGGKAAALEAGLRATDEAIVLLLDADLGETAGQADVLLSPVLAGDADMTVATFPVVPGRGGGMGLVVRLSRWGVRRLTGVTLQAPLSGQRAATRAAIHAGLPLARGFGVETALDVRVIRAGFRLVEVATTMDHRVTQNDWRGRMHRLRQLRDVAWALAAVWRP